MGLPPPPPSSPPPRRTAPLAFAPLRDWIRISRHTRRSAVSELAHVVVVLVSFALLVGPSDAQSTSNYDANAGLQVLSPTGTLPGCDPSVTTQCVLAGSLAHTQALYGTSPEGATMTGQIFVVNPTNPVDPTVDGCQFVPYTPASPSSQSGPTQRGAFYLFEAEVGCAYVDMVRSAQGNGATAVIISDYQCPCDTSSLPTNFVTTQCPAPNGPNECRTAQLPIPYMVDIPGDTGTPISIPVFMISRLDGQRLRDCFNSALSTSFVSVTGIVCPAGTNIIVSMNWSLTKSATVSWEIWRSANPGQGVVDLFVDHQFPNVTALLLANNATASPKFFILDGTQWQCTTPLSNGQFTCGTQCSNQGRYCEQDPDAAQDVNTPPNGIDVVQENARQACVWNIVQSQSKQSLFWEYVSTYASLCTGAPTASPSVVPFSESCSQTAHAQVGLDYSQTLACINQAGGYDINTAGNNSILSAQINERNFKNVIQLPTLLVNGEIIRGQLTLQSFLSAVCSGMITPAAFCVCVNSQSPSTPDTLVFKACIASPTNDSVGDGVYLTPGIIAVIVLIPVVFSCCCFVILYRRTRAHLKNEMQFELAVILKKQKKQSLEKYGRSSASAAFGASGIEEEDETNGESGSGYNRLETYRDISIAEIEKSAKSNESSI